MSLNLFSIQPPILVGFNYEFWSLRMGYFLQSHRCWDFVQSWFQEPDATIISSMIFSQRNKLEEQKQKGVEKNIVF
jgi:hypothetical protein